MRLLLKCFQMKVGRNFFDTHPIDRPNHEHEGWIIRSGGLPWNPQETVPGATLCKPKPITPNRLREGQPPKI
jgi:hypothetical protein